MAKRAKATRGLLDNQNRLYFATNRANVLPILSSGMIRSREAYEKYYDDFLADCVGRIPLFYGGLPKTLIPAVSGPGLFPVLVELDAKLVPASRSQRSISADLTVTDSSRGQRQPSPFCDVVDAPIPIAAVKGLCFPSQSDLEDFQAREFGNVPLVLPLSVSPSSFDSPGPGPSEFQAILRGIPHAPGTSDDFRRLDASMGAVAMWALLMPPAKTWLEGLASAIAFPEVSKSSKLAPNWLTALIGQILTPNRSQSIGPSVDDRLLAAAVTVLCSMTPRDGWVESRIASNITKLASADAPAEQVNDIQRWCEIVLSVASAEKQVGALDDSGSIVRRGLMLLLLRCQPERIIRACESTMRPGPQVTALAGILSGLFHGYSRLSSEIKTKACPVELLSRVAVGWWSAIDGLARKTAIGCAQERDDATSVRVQVIVERNIFVERQLRPNDSMMRLFYHAKGLEYALEYDAALDALVHQSSNSDGQSRRIVIEFGKPNMRGQATIRIRSTCLARDGKPIRLAKREDALELLERNHDPATQCQFAVEPGTGNVEVLVHQLLETMDSPELQSHVDAVNSVAAEFEAQWASRTTKPPRAKSKKAAAG